MNFQHEYLNAELTYEEVRNDFISELAQCNLFYFGHHLEEKRFFENFRNLAKFILPNTDKDCIYGVVGSEYLIETLNYLKKSYISGYVVCFDETVDIDHIEFANIFFMKKNSMLASIYKATIMGRSYDIDFNEKYSSRINFIIMTEHGEKTFSLLKKSIKNKLPKRLY